MHARAHIKTSADARILSLACVVLPAFLHTIPQLEWEVTVASGSGALEQTQNRPVVGSPPERDAWRRGCGCWNRNYVRGRCDGWESHAERWSSVVADVTLILFHDKCIGAMKLGRNENDASGGRR